MRAAVLLLGAILTQSAQPRAEDVARSATAAWTAARQAALRGGSPQSLAPARRALAELDKITARTTLQLQGEYAHALVAAAMAAAQDEREEMEVHLVQARDLSKRLQTSRYPARWPLPIDEAEGELWLEVDRYREAVAAFKRAAQHPEAVNALLGLARSAARIGDVTLACDSYGRWLKSAPTTSAATAEARSYLARCTRLIPGP